MDGNGYSILLKDVLYLHVLTILQLNVAVDPSGSSACQELDKGWCFSMDDLLALGGWDFSVFLEGGWVERAQTWRCGLLDEKDDWWGVLLWALGNDVQQLLWKVLYTFGIRKKSFCKSKLCMPENDVGVSPSHQGLSKLFRRTLLQHNILQLRNVTFDILKSR